jgi:hypothetical protein
METSGEDYIMRLLVKSGVKFREDVKHEFRIGGFGVSHYAFFLYPLDNVAMDLGFKGGSDPNKLAMHKVVQVPQNIKIIAKRLWDSKQRTLTNDSDKTLMIWLNQNLPNTLVKYGLTPAGATAASQKEESLENMTLEQLRDREKLLEVREQVRALEAKQGLAPAQTTPPQVELKPHWKIPTKPPFGYKHGDDSWLIEQMLKRQGVNVKHGGFTFGGHGYQIFVSEDGFSIDRQQSPKEIQEACRRWDEKAVLDWIAPKIPRALKSAGLLD